MSNIVRLVDDVATSPALWSLDQAASYLGITVRHLRELRYRRDITAVKVGGAIRFRKADLDAYIEAHVEEAL